MNVIQSVIQKLTTKDTLLNYSEILKECDGTFATDMTADEISKLVAFQLTNPGEWNIEKMSVSGKGAHDHVFSMSKACYVMIPFQEDIDNAKARIQEVLEEK
jgi:anionic cell wall polymer biosynthesis LytR-Cps2A-Psr (LCP) family protein